MSRADKIDKGVVERWVMSPDEHFPYHDKPAVNCMHKAIGIIKPTGYTCLGDIFECRSVSHWQWKRKKKPPLDYQLGTIDAEIKAGNKYLDKRDDVLDRAGVKKKDYIQGNHCSWNDLLVEEYPHLERTVHSYGKGYLFKDAYSFKKRGYRFYPIGKRVKYGKLYVYHGHLYGGIHHTKNHLLKMGVNVLYGHWHDIQQYSITHEDGEKSAWSVGCLKSFDYESANEWLGRRPTNWGHGFAVVDFFDRGLFTVHVVRIINGKCSLWGSIIDGN